MLQDSKTKIDIIRMQLRRALQAGQLESQVAPDEAPGEPRASQCPAAGLQSIVLSVELTLRLGDSVSRFVPARFWLGPTGAHCHPQARPGFFFF